MAEKQQIDALELLEQDHDRVRALLEELAETTPRAKKRRRELLEEIAEELRAHTRVEEEIFYPALQEAAETEEQKKILYEAFEEHRAVDELVLPDLAETDVETIQFGGRAKVLKDLVDHHADEEEDEMFKHARKLLSKEELRDLGERMQQRKRQLVET